MGESVQLHPPWQLLLIPTASANIHSPAGNPDAKNQFLCTLSSCIFPQLRNFGMKYFGSSLIANLILDFGVWMFANSPDVGSKERILHFEINHSVLYSCPHVKDRNHFPAGATMRCPVSSETLDEYRRVYDGLDDLLTRDQGEPAHRHPGNSIPFIFAP